METTAALDLPRLTRGDELEVAMLFRELKEAGVPSDAVQRCLDELEQLAAANSFPASARA